MSFLPIIGGLLGLFGSQQQASNQNAAASQEAAAAQQAAQGQTQIDQAETNVINQLLGNYNQYIQPLLGPISQQYQNMAQNIPTDQITAYAINQLLNPVNTWNLENQQMIQSGVQGYNQAVDNAAANPATAWQAPGIASNLGNSLLESLVGGSQNLALSQAQQYLNQVGQAQNMAGQALGTAANYQQAGTSILPGQENALAQIGSTYGAAGGAAQSAYNQLAASANPYASLGTSLTNLAAGYPASAGTTGGLNPYTGVFNTTNTPDTGTIAGYGSALS